MQNLLIALLATVIPAGSTVSFQNATAPNQTVGVSHPYICKDGSRPEPPGPMISKCRAEFLGGITVQGWTGPFWNPAPGIIEPWTMRCQSSTQWSKREGGDDLFYADPDWSGNRPRRGAKSCGKGF